MNWRNHYDQIYGVLGIDAILTPVGTGIGVALTVIDKTTGIETGDGVTVSSIKPGAAARVYELASVGVDRADLNGSSIAFNGNTWQVLGSLPRPSPGGEADGEVYLILSGPQ